MDKVVHFEIPFDNKDRAMKFYADCFGWQLQDMPQMSYVMANTVTTGPDYRPTEPGAINGGFYEKKPDWPMQYPSVVIAVDDIKKSVKKVAKSGGKVLGEPMEIPGVGQYVSFVDTEGNRVSMLQPIPRDKHAPKPQ